MPKMIPQSLLKAAKGFGKYCPARNELLVRRGRTTQRFILGESEIRVVTPAKPELHVLLAPDATVSEIENFFSRITTTTER